MALPARALDNLPPEDPASNWVIGIEVDLATALALARASTRRCWNYPPWRIVKSPRRWMNSSTVLFKLSSFATMCASFPIG